MNEILQLIKNRLDVKTAVLGVCGGAICLYLYTLKTANAYLLMLGVIFIFTSIIYLLFRECARRVAFSEQELSVRDELINTYSGPMTTDGRYYGALRREEPFPDPEDIKYCHAKYSYEDFCNGTLPQSMVIWREDYKDRPIELLLPSKGRMLVVFGDDFKRKLESVAYNKLYSNGQVTSYLHINVNGEYCK